METNSKESPALGDTALTFCARNLPVFNEKRSILAPQDSPVESWLLGTNWMSPKQSSHGLQWVFKGYLQGGHTDVSRGIVWRTAEVRAPPVGAAPSHPHPWVPIPIIQQEVGLTGR